MKGGAARGRAPPERIPNTCSCSRAHYGARADLAPRGVGSGARAQTPFLAALQSVARRRSLAVAPTGPAPRARAPASPRLPGGEQMARVRGTTRDTPVLDQPAPPPSEAYDSVKGVTLLWTSVCVLVPRGHSGTYNPNHNCTCAFLPWSQS